MCVLQIGLYSSLPYVFMGIFSLLSGLVADFLNAQHIITLTAIRKLFTCSGQFASIHNVYTSLSNFQLMFILSTLFKFIAFL